jgi:hypothetical protein
MAIDQIIAGTDQPTTPLMSPMQTIGGLMQLRGQMAGQSLREAQMAEVRQRQQNEKLRGDQINLDQTDQKFIQALSPEDHANIYSGNISSLYGKVQQSTIQNVLKFVDEHVNKLATNNGLKLKNRGDALGQLGNIVVNLGIPNADGSAPNSGTINSQYQSVKGQVQELFKLAEIDGPPPETIQTLDELSGFRVKLSAAKAATDAALKLKKDTADAERAASDALTAQADAAIKGKENVGTSPLGVSENQRLQQVANAATLAEQKRHNMADELTAAGNAGGGKLLTVAEAATLGVPYGTTREQAKGKSPAKESQQVTANYASRIKQSNDQLNGIEDQFADQWALTNWAADKMWNSLKSNDRQAMDQSKRNFINAVLRRESGAVITDPEFANANQQYFVQPGDGKKVIEQKRQNRNLVQRNFIKASGNAYEDPPAANAAHKVGDTVQIGDKRIKISAIHADGTFDGNEVK